MTYDWQTGDGLLGIDDPAEVDEAFERGERFVGTAVIGLVMNCDHLSVVAPRLERGLRSSDPDVRGYSFVAAANAARLFRRLTPPIYDLLRSRGLGGEAEHAIKDTLTFVPFRDLPPWFKWMWVKLTFLDFLEGWWLRAMGILESGRDAIKGRRNKRTGPGDN